MRLVIDFRLIHNSGIGTYVKNIIPFLVIQFDDIQLLGDPEKINIYEWSKKVKVVPFTAAIYSIQEQLLLPVVVPACDVFWTPHFNAPLGPIRAKKKIVTIHDVNHLANPMFFSAAKRWWAGILYSNAIRKSKAIVTVSQFSKNEITKLFSVTPEKIHVIYPGVDQNFGKATDVKHALKLPENYFLFTGNVKPHKNLLGLLKAYQKLPNAIREQYKLVILGKKEGFITNDNEVFDFIETQNLASYIYFTGYVADEVVPVVYQKASLFIFPSLYEGFGLPLLEAMCCRVPVLSSHEASLPEVGQDAVLYFDPREPDEIKEKIVALLSDPETQTKLKQKGLEHSKKFNWKSTADKHIEILKKL